MHSIARDGPDRDNASTRPSIGSRVYERGSYVRSPGPERGKSEAGQFLRKRYPRKGFGTPVHVASRRRSDRVSPSSVLCIGAAVVWL